MKTLCFLAIIAFARATKIDYNWTLFHNEIDGKCLTKLWFNNPPELKGIQLSGLTMESFISMVDKVESAHPDWDIYDVSNVLLKRFAFEDIYFRKAALHRTGAQTPDGQIRWGIISKLLLPGKAGVTFQEEDLSEEEKCTMFYMMGHSVNNTFREGVDNEDSLSLAPPDEKILGSDDLKAPIRTTKQPREQGVVTVDGNRYHGVSVSKVLNAIISSQNTINYKINDLYSDRVRDITYEYEINPLIGVTLGDVLSVAAFDQKEGERATKFFGPGGEMTSTACPTEFKLFGEDTHTTNSLLRGAVDGLLIGQAIQKEGIDGISLSRVLRMYYSPKGIPQTNGQDEGVSYCNRKHLVGKIGHNVIQGSALAFNALFVNAKLNFVKDYTQAINQAVTELTNALEEMSRDTEPEACKSYVPATLEQPICETPNDVFIILDQSETETTGFQQQTEIIGLLASWLDFGPGVGSMSVFENDMNENGLLEVSYNETDSTCAACKASELEKDASRVSESELVVLGGLNKTLYQFEIPTGMEAGLPNKVVILFHYDDVKEQNKKRLVAASRTLQEAHRDTRIFAVGSNQQSLALLVKDVSDVVFSDTSSVIVAKELTRRICKVPAIFQFNHCYDHKKVSRHEDQNVYTGYVTDGHVQFWAFYPKNYLKSYNVKITFRSENGHITVCSGRNVDNPGYQKDKFSAKDCQTTDQNNHKLVFTYHNPCEGFHVHNCPTINFAIIGDAKARPLPGCPDKESKQCRRLDQVQFKMSHEGIFCSGSEFLRSTPIMILFAFVTFLFK